MRWNLFPSTDGAGPSKPPVSTDRTQDAARRWQATLEDEERYQALQYPEYKDVPSCTTLIDRMFSCSMAGPQVRHWYRYGHTADCSNHWRDFKYCMSLKSETDEERRRLWIKRRAEWWAKRRVERSSEDVWDMRSEPPPDFPSLVPEGEQEQPSAPIT